VYHDPGKDEMALRGGGPSFGRFYVSIAPWDYTLKNTMSTAIIRYFDEKHGFVIGADGREMEGITYEHPYDYAQKISCIRDGDNLLAYSLCGCLRNKSDIDQETTWSIFADVRTAAAAISPSGSQHLREYATKLADEVNLMLKAAKTSGRLPEYPSDSGICDSGTGTLITEVFLDGYYSKVPSRATIEFRHNGQVLAPPKVHIDDMRRFDVHGPQNIWHAFWDDSGFAPYRPTVMDGYKSVEEIAAVMRGYIRACASQEGQRLCEMQELWQTAHLTIGGHAHVTVVTPSSFEWVPGFEPKGP
jgi:hypothetical protein